jgi:hypothetical protein
MAERKAVLAASSLTFCCCWQKPTKRERRLGVALWVDGPAADPPPNLNPIV